MYRTIASLPQFREILHRSKVAMERCRGVYGRWFCELFRINCTLVTAPIPGVIVSRSGSSRLTGAMTLGIDFNLVELAR